MQNLIKNRETKNSGITLMALVITIIILLILAGISLNMLSGNNGVINHTISANVKVAEKYITNKNAYKLDVNVEFEERTGEIIYLRESYAKVNIFVKVF